MGNPEQAQKSGLKKNYETKWADLKRRGFKPPKDTAENTQRLREARASG